MNPSQTPTEALRTSLPLGVQDGSHALRGFTGNYDRILGWIGVASTVISVATVCWTDYLHIDLSFLLWFWLGSCLKQGNPAARKWAIAIFLIVGVVVALGFLIPGMKANFGEHKFDRSHPAFFAITGLIALVFAVPGAMLLGERGRAAFARNEEGEFQVGAPNP